MKRSLKFELKFDQGIIKSGFRAFWIAFLFATIFVVLEQVGVSFKNPLQTTSVSLESSKDIFQEIKNRLNKKTNTFKLHKKTSLVGTSLAAGEYEKAKAYVVVDFDSGEVLAEKAMSRKLPIASLTKLMTALVALDLALPSETFAAPTYIQEIIPTHIAIKPGERMTLWELLHASLLTSANDATEVIRFSIDQKYDNRIFIKAMNKKASLIGLKTTNFSNPQGFDNSLNYSTVEDFAILSHYALTHYPLIREIVEKDFWHLPKTSGHEEHDLHNWNGLIKVYPGVSGIKIGNTGWAGNTTSVVAEREGKKVLVVLLGAPGVLERDLWASQLLDLGFEILGLPRVNITEQELLEKYQTWSN